MTKYFTLIIVAVFLVISAAVYILRIFQPAYRTALLEAGNTLMAALAVVTFALVARQMRNRPQAFVRGISGSAFLKLMVCMVSMLVYVAVNRADIHKPSIFVLFGIYAIYSTIETILLSKLARKKK